MIAQKNKIKPVHRHVTALEITLLWLYNVKVLLVSQLNLSTYLFKPNLTFLQYIYEKKYLHSILMEASKHHQNTKKSCYFFKLQILKCPAKIVYNNKFNNNQFIIIVYIISYELFKFIFQYKLLLFHNEMHAIIFFIKIFWQTQLFQFIFEYYLYLIEYFLQILQAYYEKTKFCLYIIFF